MTPTQSAALTVLAVRMLEVLDAESRRELDDETPEAINALAEYHEREFWRIIGQESEIPA